MREPLLFGSHPLQKNLGNAIEVTVNWASIQIDRTVL